MRKRFMHGGLSGIPEGKLSDLMFIWNTFFKKRLSERYADLYKRVIVKPASDLTKEDLKIKAAPKKALFVIDMQNDFLDREYTRKDTSEKNVVNKTYLNGNFDVAEGEKMVPKVMEYINRAISSAEYSKVIFSRDFHPVGHCSFDSNFGDKYSIGVVGGNFPSHCVQGETGSLLIPEIEKALNQLSDVDDKVKIVFKGMHKDGDSFTAVKKETIDYIASNRTGPCCGSGDHMDKMTYCGSISGGYIKKIPNLQNDIDFNEPVGTGLASDISEIFNEAPYTEWLTGVDVIEVCGLAGDYCVRDTIVALAKMFKDKKIVLLGDYTRYAFLPLFTTASVPIHRAEGKYPDSFNPLSREEERKQYISTETGKNKPLNYYIFKTDIPGTPPFKLLTPGELDSLPGNDDLFAYPPGVLGSTSLVGLQHFHFITDHNDIAEDYSAYPNIYIQMSEVQ